MFPITRAALAAAATLLLAPAAAGAQMQVGFQGDATIVEGRGIGRDAALDRVQQAGGQWVRILVHEQDWQQRHAAYRDSVAAAKARGLRVMVTFTRFRGIDGHTPGATAADWRALTASAVPYLAPYVDAWGSMNEPNHTGFAPATTMKCKLAPNMRGAQTLSVVRQRWQIVRYRRAATGSWGRVVKWQRVVRRGTHKRTAHGYKPVTKGGRWVRRFVFRGAGSGWVRSVRRLPLNRPVKIRTATTYDQYACTQQARGVAYRPIHDVTAQAARRFDPSAAVLAGDLAPQPNSLQFARALFASRRAPLDADGWALHPYMPASESYQTRCPEAGEFYLCNLEQTSRRVRQWKMTGGQTWVTEYGLAPSTPSRHWTGALARTERAGVAVTILYELTQHPDAAMPWDTALLNRNGSPRPSWDAVTGWLASR